jgi:hypothetical protein
MRILTQRLRFCNKEGCLPPGTGRGILNKYMYHIARLGAFFLRKRYEKESKEPKRIAVSILV